MQVGIKDATPGFRFSLRAKRRPFYKISKADQAGLDQAAAMKKRHGERHYIPIGASPSR
jgi:hypothetical protein